MQRKRTSKKSVSANQLHKRAKQKPPADDGEDAERIPRTPGAIAESNLIAASGESLITGNYTSLPTNSPRTDSVLVRTINEIPGLYSEMIGRMMMGFSLKSAATLLGVSYQSLYNWLREGADDYARGIDTYYSRLFQDIRRATAFAVGTAESSLAQTDPLKWLERGPGKQFHSDTGLWQPPNTALPQLDTPIDPLPLVDASSSPDHHAPADSIMGEAIKHLEALNISTNPEFAKQLQEQYRITGKPSADAS